MLSFFKRRSLDFKRESGTYHELNGDRKISISEEMQAPTAQPLQINHHNFDILQLPHSLPGETWVNDSFSKIPRQAPVFQKPARKLQFSRAPNPKKCESVIRHLKTILADSNSKHDLIKGTDPLAAKKARSAALSKTDSKKILSHLNDPKYANTIISMLKQEPHPPYVSQQGENADRLPRGVCLRNSESELDAQSAAGSDMEDVIDVTKALNMRAPGSSEIIYLITGLSAGTLLSTIGQSTGFYDVLAMGSKNLIDRSEGHHELIGMVPKDRVSVWCYWWGFELALPLESIARLKTAKSIESAAVQMLLALTVAGGAVELLPFIRFLGAYLDMEWAAVNEQNKGKGVVIAATWALPMALVPRPWDFDSPSEIAPLVKANVPQGVEVLAVSSQCSA
ncbi:hypothetical protein PTTG_04172 [Puccinia triticina 1-1 BBBD Race 1]|uniref:Uncharacterized protein n=2 Tax=Puccinia triticina TaxID=208348 RepID=A0A0C4ETP3_PUCT1|nr:uncharacterized protein PtA15_7A566 [Puccinia triticina]OAV95652.1 hypothetical protein PTTG_04172 [Puccinia triticina 1-1 BBBD Race 1]WAQ86837.1 hypothetical protein PtA15_7A566 [Puccinia triticina]WAR56705.1 hypothetical protein PtB15_7B555 [Puccinia triticina]